MAEDHTRTVRIKRDSKVAPDARGRNVWVSKVETVELELISTTALERILTAGDGKTRVEIRRLAESGKEGLLARDSATGHYEIVGRDELEAIAGTGQVPDKPRGGTEVVAPPMSEDALLKAEELSLVSTMMLRRIVDPDSKDKFGGFDPYNKS